MPKAITDLQAYFFQHIDYQVNGCWVWTGNLNLRGYGRFRLGGSGAKNVMAHRYAYETFKGKIPDRFVIDHLCRNHCCVNPDHLEAVTSGENQRRGARHNFSDTCDRGHKWTPENTYIRCDGAARECRTCIKQRKAEKRQALLLDTAPKPAPVGRPGRGQGRVVVVHHHPHPEKFGEMVALAVIEFLKAL